MICSYLDKLGVTVEKLWLFTAEHLVVNLDAFLELCQLKKEIGVLLLLITEFYRLLHIFIFMTRQGSFLFLLIGLFIFFIDRIVVARVRAHAMGVQLRSLRGRP